jgi:hypothetical protein
MRHFPRRGVRLSDVVLGAAFEARAGGARIGIAHYDSAVFRRDGAVGVQHSGHVGPGSAQPDLDGGYRASKFVGDLVPLVMSLPARSGIAELELGRMQ